jgi:VWFA-related protein
MEAAPRYFAPAATRVNLATGAFSLSVPQQHTDRLKSVMPLTGHRTADPQAHNEEEADFMHTRLALLLSLATCVIPVQSQESSKSGTPSFQAGTRMVLVPVIVRDHDGHTVSDLSRDSFQLFDKGKPQPIASFSVERSEPTSLRSAPVAYIAYFFDDVSLRDFGTVMPIRTAALHQLASTQQGDRVAIFTSSCQLAIDFTGDRAKLQQVVSKLVPNPVHICRVAPDVQLQITLLEAVVKRMTHLPGARRIVVVSAGFAVNAVEKPLLEALIDEAAEAKVTIDSLHITEATGAQAGMTGSDSPILNPNSSILANLGPPAPTNREANSENLFTVADGTGGTVIEAGNKPEESLRAFSTPDCVYTLGFVPAEKADGTYHKLKVTLKDSRKLNLRARAGYYATEGAGAPMTAAAPPETPDKTAEKTVTTGEVAPPSPLAPIVNALASEAPERSASSGPVSFRARTNLVQVPVVVRDKNGNPVGGLHKNDFQLADRGQKQDIIAFNEEKLERPDKVEKTVYQAQSLPNEPATAAKAVSNVIPDRFTAYLFDDIHMRRGDLAQVRESLWKHLQESASPSERIAIFTTSRRIFTDFTGDLDKLHTALYKINSTYMYRVPTCPRQACDDLSFYLGYQVWIGNAIAVQEATAMLHHNPDGAAARAVHSGGQETELSLDALRDVARRMSALAGRRTIVMISQGVFTPDEQKGELERTIDWALRSGVVINTLNSIGLDPGVVGGGVPGAPSPGIDLAATTSSEDDTAEPSGVPTPFINEARNAEMAELAYIAEATGGIAISRSNDYLGGIRRIASPPEYRYILGFSPHDLTPDGKFHALAIKLTNPADKSYSVQARKGYYAPKEGEGLPEAAAKEIENAVFSRDDVRDLPVELRTDVKDGELTVSTDIDLKLLHYRKADGRNCQELTAVAAVFDKDGNFVAGKQQTLTLKLRDATMDGLRQKPAETLQSAFALSPGAYLVRLVVRSAEDQTMTQVSTQVDVK